MHKKQRIFENTAV